MTISPGVYQHYKGNLYEVIGIGKHSETLEDVVIYKTLYKNDLSALWVRPLAMFLEDVEVDGNKMPRFKKVAQ